MVALTRGLRSHLFLIVCLATSAVAQQGSLSSGIASPTATSPAAVQTHTISVGNGDHKFRPDVTLAEIGDVIEFQFFPPNHSVVRAEYLYPCIPYEMTGRGKVGFFSGFHPVDAILSEPPKWSVTINDTDPIFFYCSAKGSCINYQMVGVINPNASVSLETQKTTAGNSSYMLQPGDPFPGEGGPSSLVISPSSTSLPSSTFPSTSTPSTPSATPPAATSPSPAAAPAAKPALSTGAIVGIAIAGVAILALAAALFFFIGRAKTLKQEVERRNPDLGLSMGGPQSPGGGVYPSFLSPKGDGMSGLSSRNSAAPGLGGAVGEGYGVGIGHGGDVGGAEMKGQAFALYGGGGGVGDAQGPPREDGGFGYGNGHARGSVNATSGAPLRHPSILLNPNAPKELYAPDGRYMG